MRRRKWGNTVESKYRIQLHASRYTLHGNTNTGKSRKAKAKSEYKIQLHANTNTGKSRKAKAKSEYKIQL
jgi:hypothetical protein